MPTSVTDIQVLYTLRHFKLKLSTEQAYSPAQQTIGYNIANRFFRAFANNAFVATFDTLPPLHQQTNR